ncbi:hypothetical protein [Nocardia exalbida]|uniref:hypothetical protein n=1 Tax=Nocardia exalbida TaxID=290231 RepID=UPI0012F7057D|nr:hypothetical protein [Nocardia exalbida]
MTSPHVRELRLIADCVLAVPNRFTPERVSAACATEFKEVRSGNPHVREFMAYPDCGPLASIVFRSPLGLASEVNALVIMRIARDIRITRADVAARFELPIERVRTDPRIPPEGTVSFISERGARALHIRFDARSQLLRDMSVHENLGRSRHPGAGGLT